MSPPSCALGKKKTIRMKSKKKGNKAAHFAERNSDRQRPHFGQFACQVGLLRHLIPRQKSQEYHEEEQTGCVMEQDEKADEEIGGRQRDGESAEMTGWVRVRWVVEEKKRNAGSPEGMRVLKGVLGCMQDELGLDAAMGAGNESCNSLP
jgi:hypothetical protein